MAEEIKRWKTVPIKCWGKAKELRARFYKEYVEANVRWTGGAVTWDSLPQGLGPDVRGMPGEPFAASCAFQPEFSLQCMEAAEAKGWSRDLCAYMRNYWGAMYINKYPFGGEFPKPTFVLQSHACCSHGKWDQVVAEYEGVPYFCIDYSIGPLGTKALEGQSIEENKHKIDYMINQCLDAIEWMEKVSGRKYDDGRFFHAVENEIRSMILWPQICMYQQNTPAPLDEKSMFSLYVFGALWRSWDETVKLYEELLDEVKWRAENQIAGVELENFRIMTDTQPLWGELYFWRWMEKYGVVSVGSLYSHGLMFSWDWTDDGRMVPPPYPDFNFKSREQALRTLMEYSLGRRPICYSFYPAKPKNEAMVQFAKQFRVDAAIIELNRGCEGLSPGQMENRIALIEAGIPVLTYEGNMGDARDVDQGRLMDRLKTFFERLNLKKLVD